jgi:hypothetical protein
MNISGLRQPQPMLSSRCSPRAMPGCFEKNATSRFGGDVCCCEPALPAPAMDIASMPLDPWSALGIAVGSIASSFLSMLLFFGGGREKSANSVPSSSSEKK